MFWYILYLTIHVLSSSFATFIFEYPCRWWLQSWNQKAPAPRKESYDRPREYIKKQRHHFADKDLWSQSYSFSSSQVCIWELDHKECWVLKNWCFWTVGLEKTLESPLDCKETKPAHPKGNQSWIFIGRNDAESPVLWPPDAKSQLIGKDPSDGKDWRPKEKGVAEDEMVREHHQFNGHKSEEILGDSGRQGSLVFCSLWSCKRLNITKWLNNN